VRKNTTYRVAVNTWQESLIPLICSENTEMFSQNVCNLLKYKTAVCIFNFRHEEKIQGGVRSIYGGKFNRKGTVQSVQRVV
jgi:hypothetical protein